MGAALFLSLFSVLMVGQQGVADFVKILTISANGEQVVIHAFDMVNLKGMLIRLFPVMEMTVIPAITWVIYLLVVFLLCFWWVRSDISVDTLDWQSCWFYLFLSFALS
jgi:hypothetical protein